MSIMPQQNVHRMREREQNLMGKKDNSMFVSHKKLFKLAPISNQLQPHHPRHKVSILDNNSLLTPQLINLYTKNQKTNQSINELLTPASSFSELQRKKFPVKGFSSQGMNSINESFQEKDDSRENHPPNNYDQSNSHTPQQPYPQHFLHKRSRTSTKSLASSSSSHSNNRLIIDDINALQQDADQSRGAILKEQDQYQVGQVDTKEQQDKEETRLTCAEYYALARAKIQQLLQSIPFQIFITLLTICSLFMEDLRTIFVDNSHDYVVDYVNIFFLAAFMVEILMSLTVENYAFSFFFYLDVISTLSICMDVTIFTDIIYNSGGNSQQISILVTQSKASRAAARAVRIMKIFRLARVVKLYKSAVKTKQLNEQKQKERLMQKLKEKKNYSKNNSGFMNGNFEGETSEYKLSFSNSLSMRDREFGMSEKSQNGATSSNHKSSSSHFRNEKSPNKKQNIQMIDRIHEQPQDQEGTQRESERYVGNLHDGEESPQVEQDVMNPLQLSKQQSKISKILSDSTIKKIIIVILIIMFSMTALDINNYYPQNTSWDFLTKYVAKLLKQPNIPIEHINTIIKKHIEYFKTLDINSDVIAFQTPFQDIYGFKTMDYSELRITEIGLSETDIDIFEIKKLRPNLTLNQDFVMSENSTELFDSVTVVLSYKRFNEIDSWFSIGKIVFICLTIIYLLQSFNTNISELIVTPIEKMLEIIVNPDKKLQEDEHQNNDFKEARYETLIVQKAIIKIRSLMSTIFGRIGMDLVYNQLFKTDNITATSYLSAKRKSFCIYGICKIQNFVEISETLQCDTFTFVNQIAQIVHSAVYRYGGYGVKNLPDGFLIVFKLPEGKEKQIIEEATKDKYSKQKQNTYLNILCDFSIYSLVKMIVRLHKEPKLLLYKKDQRILHKFGNNFHIDINLAIGIGESIEGMIGSQFKIDPTYLGGKLDEIWKVSQVAQKYPNLIIMEKELFENLTTGLKNHCRIMDYIKLNDYEQGNAEVYAVDLDLQYISPSRSNAQKYKKKEEQPDIQLKKQLNMENLKNSTEINNYYAQAFINTKKQLREVLKKKISDDMRKKYQIAFQSYISGDWIEAKQSFEEILRVIKQDVLSKRIYSFMAEKGFKYSESVKQYKSSKDL